MSVTRPGGARLNAVGRPSVGQAVGITFLDKPRDDNIVATWGALNTGEQVGYIRLFLNHQPTFTEPTVAAQERPVETLLPLDPQPTIARFSWHVGMDFVEDTTYPMRLYMQQVNLDGSLIKYIGQYDFDLNVIPPPVTGPILSGVGNPTIT